MFGPDPSMPLPALVADDTLPAPKTSYGTHKLICEHLIADYSRKGFIDGRAARLMTVTVRPGRPNGAASSFFSGIIREPLAGVESICPVVARRLAPGDVAGAHRRGPDRRLRGERRAARRPARAQPAGASTSPSREMLDALEAVAGPAVRARVRFERDERIAGIVANWPKGATAARAARLGLQPDTSFADIIRQYIADCRAGPDAAQRSGLARNADMNQIDLNGRVAVVTGGAQGIGYAIAERMLASGAAVVAVGHRRAPSSPRRRASLGGARQGRTRRVELTERERGRRRRRRALAPARQDRHPGQQRRHHRRQRDRPGSSRPTSGAA